jgi:hypothetical protein
MIAKPNSPVSMVCLYDPGSGKKKRRREEGEKLRYTQGFTPIYIKAAAVAAAAAAEEKIKVLN